MGITFKKGIIHYLKNIKGVMAKMDLKIDENNQPVEIETQLFDYLESLDA